MGHAQRRLGMENRRSASRMDDGETSTACAVIQAQLPTQPLANNRDPRHMRKPLYIWT